MTAGIFSCRINYRHLSLVYLSLHVANPCGEFVICQTCLSRESSSLFLVLVVFLAIQGVNARARQHILLKFELFY